MRKRIGIIVLLIFFIVPATYSAESSCVESFQHYEGSPKPNVYVVTVFNNCPENRYVRVRIYDAVTGKVLKTEEFTLAVRETRFVRYGFEGEKLLSYSITHKPG